MSKASLFDSLRLRGGGVISIVGAGGKTTLMERLARDIQERGETVLVTTTTKILMPSGGPADQVVIARKAGDVLKQARLLLSKYRRLTAARSYLSQQDKLVGFPVEEIIELEQGDLFRWILVEADGARHLPLKAPGPHEPVIPPSSHYVIAVAGLEAIGRPLTDEWVFRSRIFSEITGLPPGAGVTAQAVAVALSHEAGIMKGCPAGARRSVFLNKAETDGRKEQGREV
ncbi:MAG: selenium cofactor biosynthesis protein YqeC, partial [Dehalococcoidia bacterium]|nr:selenium cofactor biosynthesis protein YqeC [Dehalococcoidia bacterium]